MNYGLRLTQLAQLALLALSCTLCACAPKTLPAWQAGPCTAQFSARVLPQAADMPLQGGLRISAEGGTLGIILQHGRTLGQCTLTPEGPPQAGGLRLQCRAAEGMGARGQALLERTALAVCRALPHALPPAVSPALPAAPSLSGAPATPALAPAPATAAAAQPGWRVTPGATSPSSALQPVMYEDSLGEVHIVFSEVRP